MRRYDTDEFRCPKCQHAIWWPVQRSDRTAHLYECAARRYQASLTADSIFHRTKVSLRVRVLAIFLMAVDKGGKSALALNRELGLRCATAWLLHCCWLAIVSRN